MNNDGKVLYRQMSVDRLLAEAISNRFLKDANLKVIIMSSKEPGPDWLDILPMDADERVTRHQVFFSPNFCPFEVLGVKGDDGYDLVRFQTDVQTLLQTYPTERYVGVRVDAHTKFAGVPMANVVVVYYNTTIEPVSTTLEAIELVLTCKFVSRVKG